MMKNTVLTVFIILFLSVHPTVFASQDTPGRTIHGVSLGMSQQKFSRIYPRKTARTYRSEGVAAEWITFSEPARGIALHTITFQLSEGNVAGWTMDNRDEVVKEYLGEFCSQGIIHGMPNIYAALTAVLRRIPLNAFLQVTNRRRPILITEYYDSGTARFANTSEIVSSNDDAPAGDQGLTIIKLSSALNEAASPSPIEGVLAHELAHRVLDHARKGRVTCREEREANQLIKQWGFSDEYTEASRFFGHKPGDPASCRDE